MRKKTEEKEVLRTNGQRAARDSQKSVGSREDDQMHQSTNESIANRTRSKTSMSVMLATAEALFIEGMPETIEARKSQDAD